LAFRQYANYVLAIDIIVGVLYIIKKSLRKDTCKILEAVDELRETYNQTHPFPIYHAVMTHPSGEKVPVVMLKV
jgi:hypothetical protein